MKSFSKDQWIGIILILAALLIWAPLDFIQGRTSIGALIVIVIGLYELIFK